MRFPDTVEVARAYGTDEYGDPNRSWSDPTTFSVSGFLVTPELLLCPPTADVKTGDRVTIDGRTYEATVTAVRSPSATKLLTVRVSEVAS